MKKTFDKSKSFKKEALHKINEKIFSSHVRLVGDNVVNQIYSLSDAMKIADELKLDIVEINGNITPSICRIVDYNKFLYEIKKKEKENKKNSVKVETKEIQLSPNIGDNDLMFKIKHGNDFLIALKNIKVVLKFSGREVTHKERGYLVIQKFFEGIKDNGIFVNEPKAEGKRIIANFTFKKK